MGGPEQKSCRRGDDDSQGRGARPQESAELAGLRTGADAEFHDNACYIDSLGWVLFRRGQVDAARKELEYATTLPDGDDPVIYDHLGDVLQAQGQATRHLPPGSKRSTFTKRPNTVK